MVQAITSFLGPDASMPLVALATALVGLVVLWVLKRIMSPPLPPGPALMNPLLGDAVVLNSADPTQFMWSRFKQYGSVFKTQFLTKPMYVIADANMLRPLMRDEGALFQTPFKSFSMLMEKANIMRRTDAHPYWRRLFLTAAGPATLEVLVPRVNKVMDGHLARWAPAGRVYLYNAAKEMGMDLAIDVICNVPFSRVDVPWLKERCATFLQGLYGFPLPLPGTSLASALQAKEQVLKAIEADIQDYYASFCNKVGDASTPEEIFRAAQPDGGAAGAGGSGAGGRLDMMEASLAGSWMMGQRELRHKCLMVLHTAVAGADTTRFALFNTISLLSRSPRVQQALYDEQQQVIKEHGDEITYSIVQHHMPYMDATLKEAMRLMPASMGGMRELTEDLALGKYVLPKGSMIWYHAGMMHCIDPVLWDGNKSTDIPPHMDHVNNLDEAFKPERWMQESTRPRYSYTFGAGSHLCVGMNLVYLELKLMIARLVRAYKLELETPDMFKRCKKFPFLVPEPGTDGILLHPRQEPAAKAA